MEYIWSLYLNLVALSKARDLQPQSRLFSQIAVSGVWPLPSRHCLMVFCLRWKLQWNKNSQGMISLIADMESLTWSFRIIFSGWSMMGCVFLMNRQMCDQFSLSLLPNNMPNPSDDMFPFAVLAYAKKRVYFPKTMWAALAWMTSCKKGSCFFNVDGAMRTTVKKLEFGCCQL